MLVSQSAGLRRSDWANRQSGQGHTGKEMVMPLAATVRKIIVGVGTISKNFALCDGISDFAQGNLALANPSACRNVVVSKVAENCVLDRRDFVIPLD